MALSYTLDVSLPKRLAEDPRTSGRRRGAPSSANESRVGSRRRSARRGREEAGAEASVPLVSGALPTRRRNAISATGLMRIFPGAERQRQKAPGGDGPRRRPDGRRTLPAVGRGRDRLCHLGFDPNHITQSWVVRFIAPRYWGAANRAAAEFWVVCLLPTAVVGIWDAGPPPCTELNALGKRHSEMLAFLSGTEYHELAKFARPAYLGDFYRRVASRYLVMAEDIEMATTTG
jgi:hypothetical protein